jgi:hypothetical protein
VENHGELIMDGYLECMKCHCHIFPNEESNDRILWEEYVNDELVGYHRCTLFVCIHHKISEALKKKGVK